MVGSGWCGCAMVWWVEGGETVYQIYGLGVGLVVVDAHALVAGACCEVLDHAGFARAGGGVGWRVGEWVGRGVCVCTFVGR